MMLSNGLSENIVDLLRRAGVRDPVRKICSCSAGGNNRIYRVDTERASFVAKHYFRHDSEAHDRLAAEYAFSTYAAVAAPGRAPTPYACSREHDMALYEFVDGRQFHAGEIGWSQVEAAIAFFRTLNDERFRSHAGALPVAAEARFSISEHLDLVGSRIRLLSAIGYKSHVDRSAAAFVRALENTWRRRAAEVTEAAVAIGLDPDAPLSPSQRCVSPSDFGFHNALVTSGGAIRFLDFEYAGWDDPSKAAGDFFAQLAVPVPTEFFERFVLEIMRIFPRSEELTNRASLLRPIYQLKWCCIALNVFLPVQLARRKFSNPDLDVSVAKEQQLARAEQLFQSI